MDDLIKREAVLDYMKGWKGDTVNFVRNLPAVEAVPLDKLCEWLAEKAVFFANDNDSDPEAWKETIKECVLEGEHGNDL